MGAAQRYAVGGIEPTSALLGVFSLNYNDISMCGRGFAPRMTTFTYLRLRMSRSYLVWLSGVKRLLFHIQSAVYDNALLPLRTPQTEGFISFRFKV